MLTAEKSIRSSVDKYGKHTMHLDGSTWHLETCHSIQHGNTITFCSLEIV